MALTDTVDQYLQTLDAPVRRVADGEWGLTVDAAGWPLHIGVAWRDGLLRAQAETLGPGQVSDHELLFRNRGLVLVRYAHTSAGAVYVQGELPPELVGDSWLDRLLGALVDAATVARHRAQAQAQPQAHVTSRESEATSASGSSST
jgi:hypothetical protein